MIRSELKRILFARRFLLILVALLVLAVWEIESGLTRARVPGLFGVIGASLGGTFVYPVLAGVVSADALAADLRSGYTGLVLSRQVRRRDYLLSKGAAMFLAAALAATIRHLFTLGAAAFLLPWRSALTYAEQNVDYFRSPFTEGIPGPVPELFVTHPILNDILAILMTSLGAGALATLGLVPAVLGARPYAAVVLPVLVHLLLMYLCDRDCRCLSTDVHLNVWFGHRLVSPRASSVAAWIAYWAAMMTLSASISLIVAEKREIGLRVKT